MKKYPKVPRYDHPVVDERVFEHPNNTILLEKFDGANCSFVLYHSDFEEAYTSEVMDLNPEDNELVIFSKNKVQGTESTTDKHVRGTYGDLIDYLINTVDKDALKEIYDDIGVHQFFVEYMREHSISEYDSNIPLAIGFDVYNIEEAQQHNNISTPENKYRESFVHFLSYEKAKNLFEEINITVANTVPFEYPLDTESFEVPESDYGNIQSEGVIIRNDVLEKRYKIRSDFFKEIQKKSKGIPIKEISNEEELVKTFCPEMRIRKMVNKMLIEDGYKLSKSIIDDLYPRVNEDMWSEEYHEIMRIEAKINPSKTSPLIAKKCVEVIEKMQDEKT